MLKKNIGHLVVDTTAFIKATNLRDFAENVYTIQEVIDEITNDNQRRKLVVLPYDLNVKTVFSENIKFISDVAIKTGDYRSLSATDIKVMALTYQLEKEFLGTDHLKTEPTMQKHVKVTGIGGHPNSTGPKELEENGKQESKPENNVEDKLVNNVHIEVENNKIDDETKEVIEQIQNMELKNVDDILEKVSDEDDCTEEEESDSDEGEWITPSNIKEKTKELDSGDYFEDAKVEVACITSDFAMQNVLKQIGLNVTSVDGRVIRQLRTFIFRCTTCFKTTSVMTKLFCPKCGHATLKKVGVSIDEKGNQHIHINGRKPLTARGKRFSLPTPRGGQHFQYPILTEDQHIHKRFATRMARKKNNPLDPEYTAGFSPFVMRDVNSKSAVLGVRANNQDLKYWMKHHSNGKKK